LWKELNSDENDIAQRRTNLDKFLLKIQSEKSKAKPRIKEKQRFVKPIFSTGDCLIFNHDNGHYGGLVILAEDNDSEQGLNLVAGTRINQLTKPTLKDFENAEILIRNHDSWKESSMIVWTYPDSYKKIFSNFFELVGKIIISKEYKTASDKFGYTEDWGLTKLAAKLQFEHEKLNPKPSKTITVAKLIKSEKWWKVW
jgi:hypothetical protein